MLVPAPDRTHDRLQKLVYLLVAAEFLLLTFLRNSMGPYASPAVFYLVSVLLCYTAFRYLRDQPFLAPVPFRMAPHKTTLLLIFVIGLVVLLTEVRSLIKSIAIDPYMSDVIPAVQTYARRLLGGEWVYADMVLGPNHIVPNYLPMQWLPFTLAELLRTDYRRIAFNTFLIGTAVYLFHLLRLRVSFTEAVLKAVLPFAFYYLLLRVEPELLGYTIESLIIGYYLIMLAGVYSQSTWVRAIGLSLCLLSRFSLLFWVPLFLALIWFEEKPRKAINLVLLMALAGLVIYVIPFMSQDWLLFFRGQGYYKEAAIAEWEASLPDRPYHLFRGVGFASLFYSFVPGSMGDKVTLLQICHLLFSVLSVVVAGWFYYRWRGRIDYRYFGLISFKFYLATFYAFIQVPYVYLNSLQVFVSLWLLLHITSSATIPAGTAAVVPPEPVPSV